MNLPTSTVLDAPEPAVPRTQEGRAALIAGFALLAMAINAGLANFGAVEAVLVVGDAEATFDNLAKSRTTFILGAAGFGLVVVLDIVVAWALLIFFRPANPTISAVAALARVVYGGILAIATVQLATALSTSTDTGALHRIEAFQNIWDMGLILFGVHLLLIAWLAWKTFQVPNWVAVLVAITGVGYVIDSIGSLGNGSYSADITRVTFVGEVVLMFWLLMKGRSVDSRSPH